MRAGRQYCFEFVAIDMLRRPGSANITVTANSPPSGGGASVNPRVGEALQTVFKLQTSGWSDPEGNLPFAYGFSYLSSGGTPVRLGGIGTVAAANVLLPFGNLTTSVAVQDSLGAEASAFCNVAVSFDARRDLSEAVQNATDKIIVVPGSGCSNLPGGDERLPSTQDNANSMASIASCAELINADVDQTGKMTNPRQIREGLLNLARSCAQECNEVAMDSVELRAATLERIVNNPTQVRTCLQNVLGAS